MRKRKSLLKIVYHTLYVRREAERLELKVTLFHSTVCTSLLT